MPCLLSVPAFFLIVTVTTCVSVSSYAAPSDGSAPAKDHYGPSTHEPSSSTATSSSDITVHAGFTHPHHLNCPDSLNCLADTNDKPNHILPVIIRGAILGSPMRKLTLRGIYATIEEKWPYYRTAPTGWKARRRFFFVEYGLTGPQKTGFYSTQLVPQPFIQKGPSSRNRVWSRLILDSRLVCASRVETTAEAQGCRTSDQFEFKSEKLCHVW